MGIEAKQDALCSIKKVLRCSIRTGWTCASEHRALFNLVLLLYLLYRSSPSFFAFLLSSSPVIICTALLLGVLLSFGIKDIPELDKGEKAPAGSPAKIGTSSRNDHIKAYQKFSVPAVEENIIREASFGRANSNKRTDLDESVPLLKGDYQSEEGADAAGGRLDKMLTSVLSMEMMQEEVGMEEYMKANAEKEAKDACLSKGKADEYASLFEDVRQNGVHVKETTIGLYSSSENVREDINLVAKPNHEGSVFTDSQSGEVVDVSEHKAVDGAAGKCRWGRAFSVRQRKKLADIKIEAVNSAVDQLDYSLCSPFTRVGSHDCSPGFDPDTAERYSPDVSITDTAPMFDENNPILGADFSCPDQFTNHASDNHSNISSQDSQTDSDINDVADNSKAKDDDEAKKDAGNEPAFLWTADDEKNAVDLGYSEMERNRRLEILMVKRKSRKNIKFDLDRSEVSGITDDLSCFRRQVQPISAPRINPFADEAEMPGSAPPILHPQKSPFDFLSEPSNDSGKPARHNLDSQEFMPVSHQEDMLLKGHESFDFGRPQRHVPRFKPCFVLEEFKFDEANKSNYQRQFSDRSVSRLSVVSECDTVSSVGDQEHNDLIRNYIRGVRESPNLLRQDGDLVYTGNECSDGINFVDNETLNAIIC